jgi:hypothetical protein
VLVFPPPMVGFFLAVLPIRFAFFAGFLESLHQLFVLFQVFFENLALLF